MHGRMPLLITGFLLCRNIAITTASVQRLQKTQRSQPPARRPFDSARWCLVAATSFPASKDRFYPALGVRGVQTLRDFK